MAESKGKAELTFEFLVQKENTEVLFNNLTWLFFCAGLLAVVKPAASANYWFLAVSAAALFFILFTIAITYGTKYLVVPLVEAVFPGWKLADIQREGQQIQGFWKSFLFGLRVLKHSWPGRVYAVLAIVYELFAIDLVQVIIRHTSNGTA